MLPREPLVRELAARSWLAMRAQPVQDLAARPIWEAAAPGLAACSAVLALSRRVSQARGRREVATIGRGATSRPPLSEHDE